MASCLTRRTLISCIHPLRAKADFPIKRGPRLAFGELPSPEPMEADPITGWHEKCRRTGVLAVKLGMTREWDDIGQSYPLTILHVPDCQVVQVKTIEGDGKYALQIGSGEAKLKRTTRAMMGHFARAGVPPKKKTTEFEVTKDCLLPVGTPLYAQHYIPGMHVDVTGTTKGKGFQGGMKRWGFAGQPKTHGVSLTHRSIGSTGNRQTPGRVFKGKKMPGHMGCKLRTARNLLVFQIDPYLNTIYVKGAVPGPSNGWVRIFDTPYQKYVTDTPPFPTYTPQVGELVPLEQKIIHDDLPIRMRLNDTLGHPNNYMYKRWSLLGPTPAQLEVLQKPQTMQELVKAALEKRKKDSEAVVTRQQLEKQKQKKIIKAAKRKTVDVDE